MRSIENIVGDDDVNCLTELGADRYGVRSFERTDCVRQAFNNLPLDPYCDQGRGQLSGGKHRFRRYDDFKMNYSTDENRWTAELLPHRPFIQSPKFNHAVGGIPRHLEPMEVDPSVELDSLFNAFGFDKLLEFHAKVHQIRVITTKDIHGVAVVEGPHRDGQDWQIVAVFDRNNIDGGQSQFLPNGGGEPFLAKTLEPGTAICNKDAAMWHNATDIRARNDEFMGHRDIFIIATNRWSHRKYGDEFEAASLINGTADWEKRRPKESLEVMELGSV